MIRSAGHSLCETRSYTQSQNSLIEYCLDICSRPLSPNNAYEMVSETDIDCTLEDISAALAFSYSNLENHWLLGAVISALYAKTPDRVIVHDLDTPVSFLGMCLKEKILINKGTVGEDFGCDSDCTIINLGTAGIHFGAQANGVLINAGTVASYGDGTCYVKDKPWVKHIHGSHNTVHNTVIPGEKIVTLGKYVKKTCKNVVRMAKYNEPIPEYLLQYLRRSK